MNKNEFYKELSTKSGFTQKDVKTVMEIAQEVVFATVASEGEVKIFDGVTFRGEKKPACQKRNPATGDMVDVPEKIAVKVKLGKAIKDAANA